MSSNPKRRLSLPPLSRPGNDGCFPDSPAHDLRGCVPEPPLRDERGCYPDQSTPLPALPPLPSLPPLPPHAPRRAPRPRLVPVHREHDNP
jgi:hypothetical protein